MFRLRNLATLLAFSGMAIPCSVVLAETLTTTPTLSAPVAQTLKIERIQAAGDSLFLQLDGREYQLPPNVPINWENGSQADSATLAPGIRVRVQSHIQDETIVIDQLTITTD